MRAIDNYTDNEREVLALKGMTAPRTASERCNPKPQHCPRCNMPTYRHKLNGLMDCGNDCKDRGLLQ